VLAVDTNVLDADSQFHTACRDGSRICTRDTDFNQFPLFEVIDPLRP
jgi:hypothetical protein